MEIKKIKRATPKKYRKINITQEDLDKLCEVYDWYMEVKDLKSMKSKSNTNKKDIKIEDTNLDSLKSTSIKVDKKKIDLKETIKTLGTQVVEIKLFEGVVGKVKVDVISE